MTEYASCCALPIKFTFCARRTETTKSLRPSVFITVLFPAKFKCVVSRRIYEANIRCFRLRGASPRSGQVLFLQFRICLHSTTNESGCRERGCKDATKHNILNLHKLNKRPSYLLSGIIIHYNGSVLRYLKSTPS